MEWPALKTPDSLTLMLRRALRVLGDQLLNPELKDDVFAGTLIDVVRAAMYTSATAFTRAYVTESGYEPTDVARLECNVYHFLWRIARLPGEQCSDEVADLATALGNSILQSVRSIDELVELSKSFVQVGSALTTTIQTIVKSHAFATILFAALLRRDDVDPVLRDGVAARIHAVVRPK